MDSQKLVYLSTAYFAPVQYYSKLMAQDATIWMEKHEHYNKQSYRNRCTIYSANGLLDLVVPVVKFVSPKTHITDVEIAYDMPWQKLHFKAIESAYRRSPFYEYYIDDLLMFFKEKFRFLYDYNWQILEKMCQLINIPFRIKESDAYLEPNPGAGDWRNAIHPKPSKQIPDPDFTPLPYVQVFGEKWGFKPNLSILDLLFNEGPQTISKL